MNSIVQCVAVSSRCFRYKWISIHNVNVIDSAACAEYSQSRGWCILWKGYVAESGAGPRAHKCPQFRTLGVTPSSQLRSSLRELRAELSVNDTMVNWQKHNKFYQLNGKGFRKPTLNVWLLPRHKRGKWPFLDFSNSFTKKMKRLIEIIWQTPIKKYQYN